LSGGLVISSRAVRYCAVAVGQALALIGLAFPVSRGVQRM
jgi:hypothetical protein